jgi:hypothetical protein
MRTFHLMKPHVDHMLQHVKFEEGGISCIVIGAFHIHYCTAYVARPSVNLSHFYLNKVVHYWK